MLLVSTLALLMASQATQTTEAKPVAEADPIQCERMSEPGSMIRKKKVCMRKSEWAEQRRTNRQAIEKAQIERQLNSGG